MPVHQFVSEHSLQSRGLTNYWGYNTIGFLAPHKAYSSSVQRGGQVGEFKAMVKELHAAGIEVILDVVYNHTAESDHRGPTLSFRGIDNAAYYRLRDDDQRYYVDYTGCGNSLNVRHPHALQLILDSLRYWILEMHVDGFRFDLASALARELHDVDRLSAFFDLVQQDPVVSQVKLIAEPWDVGEGGYQVGNFPPLWSEWNGKYRDAVRDFWRGQPETLPEFASRLTGSSDLYETSGRRPVASINFVTCHDGFTLADLVSYNRKHNEANGEDNADGTDDNRSWNCGTEGPSQDPAITALRSPAAAQLPGHPALLAGRADAAGRRRAGPHPAAATTTPTARTTSCPGWTGRPGRPRPGCSSSPGPWPSCAAITRCSAGAGSSAGPATAARAGSGDIAWFTPSGREMTGRATGRPGTPRRWACSSTATPSPSPTRAASRYATTRSCCCSARTASPPGSPCPGRATARAGKCWSTRRRTARPASRCPAAPPSSTRPARPCWCAALHGRAPPDRHPGAAALTSSD